MPSRLSITRNAEKKLEEAEEDNILEAAFQRVHTLYPSEQKLDAALITAGNTVNDLIEQKKNLEARLSRREDILEIIEEHLDLLVAAVDEEELENDDDAEKIDEEVSAERQGYVVELLNGCKDLSSTPKGYNKTEEKKQELKIKIQKAKMRLNVIQGAQASKRSIGTIEDDMPPAKVRRV